LFLVVPAFTIDAAAMKVNPTRAAPLMNMNSETKFMQLQKHSWKFRLQQTPKPQLIACDAVLRLNSKMFRKTIIQDNKTQGMKRNPFQYFSSSAGLARYQMLPECSSAAILAACEKITELANRTDSALTTYPRS
jgi:hypothetical protein